MADESGGMCRFTRDLTEHDTGADVQCLQRFLAEKGLLHEPATGYYGQKTKDAASRWQARAGITPASGYFGALSRARYHTEMAHRGSVGAVAARPASPAPDQPLYGVATALAGRDADGHSDASSVGRRRRRPGATAGSIPDDSVGGDSPRSVTSGDWGADAAAVAATSRNRGDDAPPSLGDPPPQGFVLRGLRVALDVGHGKHPLGFEVGTKGNGQTEFELNKIAAAEVGRQLRRLGAAVSVFTYDKGDHGLWLWERGRRGQGHHLFVSLHHNGHNGTAQGTETIIDTHGTTTDATLAHYVQQEVVRCLQLPNRGVKWQDLGVLGGVTEDVEAACLVEPYFIDDRTPEGAHRVGPDLTRRAARGVAEGIRRYWLERHRPQFRVQVKYAGEADLTRLLRRVPGAWCVRRKGGEAEGCPSGWVQAGSFTMPERAETHARWLADLGFEAAVRSSEEDKEKQGGGR